MVLLLCAELPEMSRACVLYTAATQCSHACAQMGWVLRLCRGRAGSTALSAYVLPVRSHLCSKFIASVHIPFPFSLHIGFIPWVQNMFCIWNVGFAVLKAPSTCKPTSDWQLWTEVCKSSQGPFWLQWCHVNLGLTRPPQCLKLTPSSFKFSNKFSSLVLLLAIQVAKWCQHSCLLHSDLEKGSG